MIIISTCPVCEETLFSVGRVHGDGSWYMLYWCEKCGYFTGRFAAPVPAERCRACEDRDDVIAPEIIHNLQEVEE